MFVLGFFLGLLAGGVESFLYTLLDSEIEFAFGIVELTRFFYQFGLRVLRFGKFLFATFQHLFQVGHFTGFLVKVCCRSMLGFFGLLRRDSDAFLF